LKMMRSEKDTPWNQLSLFNGAAALDDRVPLPQHNRRLSVAFVNRWSVTFRSHLSESEVAGAIGMVPGAVSPLLTSLNFSRTAVSDTFIAQLSLYAPNLVHLRLDGCHNVTDVGIVYLAQNCHRIASLSLAKCDTIGDTAIESVALGMPQLVALNVTDCRRVTGNALRAIIARCPLVQSLCIGGTAIEADALAEAASLFLLVELDISGLPVDDGHLCLLARHQPLLKSLTMNFCDGISATALREIVAAMKVGKVVAFGVDAAVEVGLSEGRLVF